MLLRNLVITSAIICVSACGGSPSGKSAAGDPQNGSSNPVGAGSGSPPPAKDTSSSGAVASPSLMMPMPAAVGATPTAPVTTPTAPVTTPTAPVTTPTTPVTTPTTPPTTTPPVGTAPAARVSFQYLPVLDDADGNPNDASATYNLTVDNNVPVNVVTPTGSWITPMMRYNGLQLPPVIKAKRGTNITVNVKNNLAENTTVHWHGFKIPAIQDGGPDLPILPGGSHSYNFQLVQPAAPLWFHPHAMGTTATQVYRGLAGGFIVTDDISDNLEATKKLPASNYDIAMLVQDRSFAADNGTGVRPLVYNAGGMTRMTGMLGDRILVNGAEQPTLDVETRQYRFRLFNGSNARTYDFALSNAATFKVISTDGGLLPAPVTTDHVVLAPGERTEIVLDFRANGVNDSLALINRTTANREVVRFAVAAAASDDVTLYSTLPSNADINQRLSAADATNTRNFVMSMAGMMSFVINGKRFDINRVDELVTAGATEIWNISNTSGMAHPFHAHAIQWQILDRNNIPASGIDLGWKDTVLVQPGESVRFIGRFDPVINTGLYLYHCHILEHEEAGMMGTFKIQ